MVLTKDSGWLSLSYNSKNILITRAYYEDTTGRSPLYCHFYYREETGILKGTSCFKNGKKDGPSFGFNDRGDIMWTTTYDKGKFVSETKFSGYDPDADADSYYPHIASATWQKFLVRNFRYPQEALDKNIQGKVVISFIVSADGRLSDFKVEESVHPDMDAEAIRVLKACPDWQPAMRDGKKVSMRTDMPFVFKLG